MSAAPACKSDVSYNFAPASGKIGSPLLKFTSTCWAVQVHKHMLGRTNSM